MAKTEKLFSKIVIIIFLVMIVLGFTLPGFLELGENKEVSAEQRICQADADCYLLCDDIPVVALCSKNLCQQNSCGEKSYYEYNVTPISFSLQIEVVNLVKSNESKLNGSKLYESKKVDLENMVNSNDIFVKFSDDKVNLYSSGLSLNDVLEKLGMSMTNKCLVINDEQYCEDDEKELSLIVNDKESYSYGQYLPKEGDTVKIAFNEKLSKEPVEELVEELSN
ncbi:MAG: hypothetical protein KKD75_02970, partial [Nanoarchaeota archaeon]|nr:hypothetical protein [Nanoarchaeota archaeon]MBU1632782.1 hypothetical protein [Nanoarchaeota archaeon]MBU1876535.1 hypothetical protein [Nanoarchaeota archaeon]